MASTYIDPSADGANNAWTKSTGTAGFSLVDDAVRQPTAPTTGSDMVTSTTTAGTLQDLVFPDTLTYNSAAKYILWVYGAGGNRTGWDTLISTDDSTFANQASMCAASTTPPGFQWFSRDVTSLITSQAKLNGFRVRLSTAKITGSGAVAAEVDAVYLEQDVRAISPASVSTTSAMTAAPGRIRPLSATAPTTSAVTASVGRVRHLAPAMTASSSMSAAPGRVRPMAPAATAGSAITAAPGRVRPLAATPAATSAASAAPGRVRPLSASAPATSALAASPGRLRPVLPDAVASSSASFAALSRIRPIGLATGGPFSTQVLDDFGRGNQNPISSPWAKLDTGINGITLTGNQVTGRPDLGSSADAASYLATTSGLTDCEGYITVTTAPDAGYEVAVLARAKDVGGANTFDCYQAVWVSTTVQITKVTDGVAAVLVADHGQPALSDGYKLGIRCVGSTISAWIDTGSGFTKVLETTDTSYTSGYLGLWLVSDTVLADDFGGGAATSAEGLAATSNTTASVRPGLAPVLTAASTATAAVARVAAVTPAAAASSDVAAALNRIRPLAGTATANSDLTLTAIRRVRPLRSSLSATSELAAVLGYAGAIRQVVPATVTADSALAAAAARVRPVAATFAANSDIAVAEAVARAVSVSFTATSSVSAVVVVIRAVTAAVSSSSDMSAATARIRPLSASSTATSDLSAAIGRVRPLTVSLTATSVVTAVLARLRTLAPTATAASTVTSQAAVVRAVKPAMITSTSTAGANVTYVRAVTPTFAASSNVTTTLRKFRPVTGATILSTSLVSSSVGRQRGLTVAPTVVATSAVGPLTVQTIVTVRGKVVLASAPVATVDLADEALAVLRLSDSVIAVVRVTDSRAATLEAADTAVAEAALETALV